MHLNVICRVCEKNAIYNTTLGVYYCPSHGYETRLEDMNEHMDELISSLEHMQVSIY